MGRLPNVFLVGVPKAGTSALARGLATRPDVYLPADKEVHFFDERASEGLDWYRGHFPVGGDCPIVMDATPTYALRDDWFEHLASTVPDARIVLLLRHPVERLWSGYWYLRSLGMEPRSLERAVSDELAGRSDLPYDHIDTGVYPPVLDRVVRSFPDDRVLVLLHDDLRADPEATHDRTCRFLGLDPAAGHHQLGQASNVTGTLRSFPLRYWTLRLHLFRRAPRLAHALDRWNRTERRPPPMPEHLRAELLDHYAASIDELERRLGRDLSNWRR